MVMKQMKVSTFCNKFGISKAMALKLIHSERFPAYNIFHHWYIDVPEFKEFLISTPPPTLQIWGLSKELILKFKQ